MRTTPQILSLPRGLAVSGTRSLVLGLLAALSLGGCREASLTVYEPDAFPVPLHDVSRALVASAEIVAGQDVMLFYDGYTWEELIADYPSFWETVWAAEPAGAVGQLRVVLGGEDIDCADLEGGGVPASGSGLVLKWSWWTEEGSFPGWTGFYPTDAYALDGGAARMGALGVWQAGSWAYLNYGSFDGVLEQLDEDRGRATVTSDLLDLQLDAEVCVPPETDVEAP